MQLIGKPLLLAKGASDDKRKSPYSLEEVTVCVTVARSRFNVGFQPAENLGRVSTSVVTVTVKCQPKFWLALYFWNQLT